MASRAKVKTSQRVARELAKLEGPLKQFIKAPLPTTGKPPKLAAVLKALHALGTLALGAKDRARLRGQLVTALTTVMGGMKLKPADLGVADVAELAEHFVRMVERVRYGRHDLWALPRKVRKGLHGGFAGKLFEELVANHVELQADLMNLAAEQLGDLWKHIVDDLALPAVLRNEARLVDAHGKPIPTSLLAQATFSDIHKATDIVRVVGNQRLQFTDFSHVTFVTLRPSGKVLVSFLVEVETKLPRSAANFPEQIGLAQQRYELADSIEITIPGRGKPLIFTPDMMIFDRGNINRTAVTTTRRKRATYAFRATNQGAYDETYLRVGLAMDIDELRRVVDVMFRQ